MRRLSLKTVPQMTAASAFSLIAFSGVAMAQDPRLAFSDRLGIEVFADGGKSWCGPKVSLRIQARDPKFFESDGLTRLMPAIGGAVAKECPAAAEATLRGTDGTGRTTLWQGTASRATQWAASSSAPQVAATPPASRPPQPLFGTWPVTGQAAQQPPSPSVAAPPPTPAVPPSASAADGPNVAQAPTTPASPPAPVATAPEPSAQTAGTFQVNGWAPTFPPRPLTLGEGVIETEIDVGGCKMVLAQPENPAGSDAIPEVKMKTGGCQDGYLHGEGDVQLRRGDGRVMWRYSGNFTRGYLTGRSRFDLPLILRTGDRNEQWLVFYLWSDPRTNVHALGYTASRFGDAFAGCGEFQVRLVTDNEGLFKDFRLIEQLVNSAGLSYQAACPQGYRFRMVGVTEPGPVQLNPRDPKFLYLVDPQKTRGANWEFNPNTAINAAYQRQEIAKREEQMRLARERQEAEMRQQREMLEREQKRRRAEQDYLSLGTAPLLERVAYLHGVPSISHPGRMALASEIVGAPANGTVFVRVVSVSGDTAKADWPSPVEITGISQSIGRAGWYVITGEVTAGPANEDGPLPVARLAAKKVTACEKDRCEDTKDVLSLIRRATGIEDWTPERAGR